MKSVLLSGLLVAVLTGVVSAADDDRPIAPEAVPLWSDGAPHAVGDDDTDRPTIRVYRPDAKIATGTGIVICPGGGYGILATDHEGHQVARWLNRHGIAGFVLRYRLAPNYRHPVPMEDAQRAMRHVRANAEAYGLAKDRIGILGFSAGGHLASTVATHFDAGRADAADPVDRESCRPDFAVLCYPVISLVEPFTHKGSIRNLLGPEPDAALLELLSNERQVTPETPPTFLWHTHDDTAVPVENSLAFYGALRKAGVPGELHIYQQGPHGIGLAPASPTVSTWADRMYHWLQASSLLGVADRVTVRGTIKVQGTPVKFGMIALVPQDARLPRAWTSFRNGQFTLSGKNGAAVGINQVEIHHLGDVAADPTTYDARGGLTPIVFNVVAGEDNVFDVDLDRLPQ